MSSYFCVQKYIWAWPGICSGSHKVEIATHQPKLFSQGSGKESCSKFILLVCRINFFCVIRQMFSFSGEDSQLLRSPLPTSLFDGLHHLFPPSHPPSTSLWSSTLGHTGTPWELYKHWWLAPTSGCSDLTDLGVGSNGHRGCTNCSTSYIPGFPLAQRSTSVDHSESPPWPCHQWPEEGSGGERWSHMEDQTWRMEVADWG